MNYVFRRDEIKKIIFTIFLAFFCISFSDITGIDTKKIIRSHYTEKDLLMKKSDYFLPKTGKEFNFRAFEWNTSKETALKFFDGKNYTDRGNELIFTNINFAGMVLSELKLNYENDKLVSWIGFGRADAETLKGLQDTYNSKYKGKIIETNTDALKMYITRDRENSFFIIFDPDMTTFYYQSAAQYDRIIRGETEEKELERIRIENEKKQKEKVKQDMFNDL